MTDRRENGQEAEEMILELDTIEDREVIIEEDKEVVNTEGVKTEEVNTEEENIELEVENTEVIEEATEVEVEEEATRTRM